MESSPQGIRTKGKQVIKINETKAVIMYTVDQQITSGGPRIYLSSLSVANMLMWLDRLGMFTYSHLLSSPWEMCWIKRVVPSFCEESSLVLLKYFMRYFLLIPKAAVLQLSSWMTFLANDFSEAMRLVPLNWETWEYSLWHFLCFIMNIKCSQIFFLISHYKEHILWNEERGKFVYVFFLGSSIIPRTTSWSQVLLLAPSSAATSWHTS